MRKRIVAGNWKMNLTHYEGVSLFSEIVHMAKDELRDSTELIVCVPFIHLHSLVQLAKANPRLAVGAQNIYHENAGAFTGEISAAQVASTGAEYVIIGHSERRMYFQEDGFQLAKKIDIALEAGLKVIFCIGESLDERESGDFLALLSAQLEEGIGHLSAEQLERVVLAYEPVWAIGTGRTASPEQAQEVHAHLREKLARMFHQEAAQATSILYGGSCNRENAAALFAQKDIDGGLIGGASLKSRDFVEIAKINQQAKR